MLLVAGGSLLTTKALQACSPLPAIVPKARDRIKNIVIFIQENHSFDSLFAGFPGANSQHAGADCPDSLLKDPPHKHTDAFEPQGVTSDEARCSYREVDAPNYWKAARSFTLCDNYYSDVRGPSYPNFLMMIAGQTVRVEAATPTDMCPDFCLDLEALPHRLDAKGLTWKDYGGIFTSIRSLAGRPEVMNFQDERFFADAAHGELPQVSWLNSGFLVNGNAKSGHPPHSLCVAENYAVSVLNAIMQGPQWADTALFFMWDEWGGFYDHVEPPTVETWSDGTPYRYGHRVPCMVISPYARKGYVSHTLYSHVSLLRFAETIFDLEPLTERDAEANDMLDCFDFDQSPLPPVELTSRPCE